MNSVCRIVVDRLQPVAVVGQIQVVYQAVAACTCLPVAEQAEDVSGLVVAGNLLVEPVGVAGQRAAFPIQPIRMYP